ncbi:MAG: hypothetical protein JXA30_21745 [Deltaproteobacteria bacterium]|nr:hypothetical protein [Deltaproteobacteria bacterium]
MIPIEADTPRRDKHTRVIGSVIKKRMHYSTEPRIGYTDLFTSADLASVSIWLYLSLYAMARPGKLASQAPAALLGEKMIESGIKGR